MTLLVVLIALGIISAISVGLVRMSMLHRRQAEREGYAAQTRWLAESGLDRAVALLKQDANSKGTVWTIAPKDLNGRHSAKVTIEIQAIENTPQRRRVAVTAVFPEAAPQQTRTQLERFVDL